MAEENLRYRGVVVQLNDVAVDFAIESISNNAKAVDISPLNGGDSGASRGSGRGSFGGGKEEKKSKELEEKIGEGKRLKELGLSHLQGKYLYIAFEASSECDSYYVIEDLPRYIVLERLAASKLVIKQDNNPSCEHVLSLEKEFQDRMFSKAVMMDSKIYVVGGSIDEEEDSHDAEADLVAECDSDDETDPYPGVTSIDISNMGECRSLGHDCVAKMGQGKYNPLLVELETDEEGYDLCDRMKKKIYALPGIPSYDSDNFYDPEENYYSDDLKFEVYDPVTNKWDTIMPPPPFLNDQSYNDGGYESAVVLNNKLHVSTMYKAYCFDPKNNSWGPSHLLADLLLMNGFPGFRGTGLVLFDGKVFIGSYEFGGIYAYLINDEGKVSHCQHIDCIDEFCSPKMEPACYVDLGCDADGCGYFCLVFAQRNKTFYGFGSVGINTLKIKMLKEGERSSRFFLDVQIISAYTYSDLEEKEEEEDEEEEKEKEMNRILKNPIGCFLIGAIGESGDLPEDLKAVGEGRANKQEQCGPEIVQSN